MKHFRHLLLVSVLLMLVLAPSASARSGAVQTRCPSDPEQPWVAVASKLFESDKDAAAEIYRAVLDKDPTNECAVRGLADVSAAKNADEVKQKADEEAKKKEDAKEKAADEKKVPGVIGRSWSEALKNWFTPLGPPLLAAAAVLLFLLALTQLVTPRAVHPDHQSWPDWLRISAWWSGLAALILAAAAPAIAAVTAPPADTDSAAANTASAATGADTASAAAAPRLDLPIGILASGIVVAALIAALVAAAHLESKSDTGQKIADSRFLAVWAVAAIVPALAILLFVRGQETGWPVLVLGADLGLVGIALMATARAQSLRLTVDARGTSGAPDGNAAQYVVAKLAALGTHKPSGLETPQQSDVTSLPADALAAVPESGIAKAVFALIQAVRPSAPWNAVVGVQDASTVVISLTRNGRSAGIVSMTRAELGLPTLPKDAADGERLLVDSATQHLLTAAAAYILIELSKRHPQLQHGLCGATNASSLAMHAIATDSSRAAGSKLRADLLTRAVAADPNNALARVGDLNRLGAGATAAGQKQVAEEARAEYNRLEGKDDGYDALRLRLLYTRIAALFNSLQLAGRPVPYTDDCIEMVTVLIKLVRKLQERPLTHLDELVIRIRGAVAFIALSVIEELPPAYRQWSEEERKAFDDLPTEVKRAYVEWRRKYKPYDDWYEANKEAYGDWPGMIRKVADGWAEKKKPLAGSVAYARACWLATERPEDWKGRALEDLRVALSDERRRVWAPKDPSLKRLRSNDEFKKLVYDDPPSQFLDIRGIKAYRSKLKAIGVDDEHDLLRLPVPAIAEQLDVPSAVVTQWVAVAKLVAEEREPNEKVPVWLADMLVTLGVYSRYELRVAVAQPGWQDRVDAVAKELPETPPRGAGWDKYT